MTQKKPARTKAHVDTRQMGALAMRITSDIRALAAREPTCCREIEEMMLMLIGRDLIGVAFGLELVLAMDLARPGRTERTAAPAPG